MITPSETLALKEQRDKERTDAAEVFQKQKNAYTLSLFKKSEKAIDNLIADKFAKYKNISDIDLNEIKSATLANEALYFTEVIYALNEIYGDNWDVSAKDGCVILKAKSSVSLI